MYELNCDGSEKSPYCRENITDGYLSNLTTGNANWYDGQKNSSVKLYDYSKNIKRSSKDKIAKVKWNLGGAFYGISALSSYNEERETKHITNPTDGIQRVSTWDGKIALLYPSDYGFASTDENCRSKLNSSDNNNDFYCKNNNWLFNNTYYWTLSPCYYNSTTTFLVFIDGRVHNFSVANAYNIRPVLFLKSSVTISGGNGALDNPYTID